MVKKSKSNVSGEGESGAGDSGSGRSLIPRGGNDVIFTPDDVALSIVSNLPIYGTILEPCKGGGAFLRAFEQVGLDDVKWCEIAEGKDFFDFHEKVDWIITNPPFSKFADFLEHGLEIADNVVFLATWNHFTTKKRVRMVKQAGFGYKEIMLHDTPATFPQSGFQVASIWLQKDFSECTLIY